MVVKLLEDPQQATLIYKLSRQQSIDNQITQFSSSSNPFLGFREEPQGAKGKVESILERLGRLCGSDSSVGDQHGSQRRVIMFEALEAIKDEVLLTSERSSTVEYEINALSHLIKRAFTLHEFPSLVKAILSSEDKDEAINRLPVNDAQALIDVLDETVNAPDLSPLTQKNSLKLLYKTCGHHARLPKALDVSVHYDRTRGPLYRGGYADVWKGEYSGQEVAVKIIRTYSNRELQRVVNKFCKEVVMWKFLQHPNVLPLIGATTSENLFVMVSGWMRNGNIIEFVKTNPGIDRLGILSGVAEGLIYLHNTGMIHGDLKGANILIDENCNARLADFGLLTIISDPANLLSSSSNSQGGTVRWMAPELIAPQQFGFDKSRSTKFSDCYALGMVIYETISGHLPFHEDTDYSITLKVVKGERPQREAKFINRIWEMLKLCWAPRPSDRPSIEDVLWHLQMISSFLGRPYPETDEEVYQQSERSLIRTHLIQGVFLFVVIYGSLFVYFVLFPAL